MRQQGVSGDTIADWSHAFELVPSLDTAYVWHASAKRGRRVEWTYQDRVLASAAAYLGQAIHHPRAVALQLAPRALLVRVQDQTREVGWACQFIDHLGTL